MFASGGFNNLNMMAGMPTTTGIPSPTVSTTS